MIADLAADLVAKVKSVPAFTSVTAVLTLGGRVQDPGLLKVPLPAAWVVFKTDGVEEQSLIHGPSSGLIPRSQEMMATFLVTVFIEYTSDADMLATQFPLLEVVAEAIHGTEAAIPGFADGYSAYRWRYVGQKIALVYPDRLAYEQRYTISYVTNA